MKRGILLGDLHCGHLVGLTPPAFHVGTGWREKFRKIQRETWDWFEGEIKGLGWVPDVIIHNGDAIEGDGHRSGATELISTDPQIQADMATMILREIGGKDTKYFMTYGTPSHTGVISDFEDLIAHSVGAEIRGHHFLNIDGVMFDVKHKVGSSGIPHGRGGSTRKEKLWNSIWAEAGEQPNADVLVRSHVHYCDAQWNPDWGWAFTLPALQAAGSKYGARQCSGRVHYGFISFTVDDGEFSWQPHIAKLKAHKKEATVV